MSNAIARPRTSVAAAPKLTLVPELATEQEEPLSKFDVLIEKFLDVALTKSIPFILTIVGLGTIALVIRAIAQKAFGI